jgi:hypothetical protein
MVDAVLIIVAFTVLLRWSDEGMREILIVNFMAARNNNDKKYQFYLSKGIEQFRWNYI